jgi:hypothetical protein
MPKRSAVGDEEQSNISGSHQRTSSDFPAEPKMRSAPVNHVITGCSRRALRRPSVVPRTRASHKYERAAAALSLALEICLSRTPFPGTISSHGLFGKCLNKSTISPWLLAFNYEADWSLLFQFPSRPRNQGPLTASASSVARSHSRIPRATGCAAPSRPAACAIWQGRHGTAASCGRYAGRRQSLPAARPARPDGWSRSAR